MIRPEFAPILDKLAGENASTRRVVARTLSELAQATPASSVGILELEEIARTVRAPVLRHPHVVGHVADDRQPARQGASA